MLFPENPVLRKELLLRFRIRQSTPVKIGIVSLMVLALVYLHYVALESLMKEPGAFAGQAVYQMTFGVQFLLVGLLAPALTANAISQEREQQTWEMLLVSRLTVGEILWGKLLARCLPLLLVILLGMPLASVGWEHWLTHAPPNNGINDATLFSPPAGIYFWLNYAALFAMGAFFASFAFYLSLRFKRTLYAMLGSYAFIVGFLCVGTTLITGTLEMLSSNHSDRLFEDCPLMWLNPLMIVSSLTSTQGANYTQALVGAFVYALLAALMLRLTFSRFKRHAYDR